MSNLSIRKKSINTWLHTDSVFGDFIISKFYFNSFFAKFQIVEEGNTRLEQYEIANITLYDDTDGGAPEYFATITELSLRLEELQYPAFDRTGTSVFPSMEQITNVNVTDVEDGQVLAWDVATSKWVNITIGGLTTPNFQEVTDEGATTTNTIEIDIDEAEAIIFYSGGEVVGQINTTNDGVELVTSDVLGENRTRYRNGNITVAKDGGTPREHQLPINEDGTFDLVAIIVNANKTAENDAKYTVIANATFTDPTPVEGKGYTVFVRNGTATIGGVGYTAGSLVYRFYQGGVWGSTSIGGTVPDASPTVKGIAKLYENLLASNTDGSVHQSALVTEFATKQTNFYKDASTSTAVTGTTANTILVSHLIPANTFAVGTVAEVRCNIQRVGANANATYRMYTNTSNSLTGATQIATFNNTTTGLFSPFKRLFALKTGNLLFGAGASSTLLNDEVINTTAPSSTSFDPTVDNYIIISVIPQNASDSFTSETFTIKGNK